jgi:hypothetical protein
VKEKNALKGDEKVTISEPPNSLVEKVKGAQLSAIS